MSRRYNCDNKKISCMICLSTEWASHPSSSCKPVFQSCPGTWTFGCIAHLTPLIELTEPLVEIPRSELGCFFIREHVQFSRTGLRRSVMFCMYFNAFQTMCKTHLAYSSRIIFSTLRTMFPTVVSDGCAAVIRLPSFRMRSISSPGK